MATYILLQPQQTGRGLSPQRLDIVHLLLCSGLAFLLLGYHPYAEDGGIYAAAAALRLRPALFPSDRAFAGALSNRSLFIPLVSGLVRLLHVPLPAVLLLLHCAGIVGTLRAAQALARELFLEHRAQCCALWTTTVCLGLPVAGTSLYLFDPHLTARSLSTPLLLASVLFFLQRRMPALTVCLVLAVCLHPLMAGWACLLLLLLAAQRSTRCLRWTMLICMVTLLGMAATERLGAPASAALRAASLSRDYWFLSRWHWYETMGMAAVPMLLAVVLKARTPCHRLTTHGQKLAAALAVATVLAGLGSLLFIHPASASMLLPRLQPLRLLHLIYFPFLLIVGGLIGSVGRRGNIAAGVCACTVAAVSLLAMQRTLYAHSCHLEWPWRRPANAYAQAFVWIQQNTRVNDVFALDAKYTTVPGEDAQGFRAIAERSVLADAAKDGGVSSVTPELAGRWLVQSRAQNGLATLSDKERLARVQPLGVTWIVLPAVSTTGFHCPYRNELAQVCRLQ